MFFWIFIRFAEHDHLRRRRCAPLLQDFWRNREQRWSKTIASKSSPSLWNSRNSWHQNHSIFNFFVRPKSWFCIRFDCCWARNWPQHWAKRWSGNAQTFWPPDVPSQNRRGRGRARKGICSVHPRCNFGIAFGEHIRHSFLSDSFLFHYSSQYQIDLISTIWTSFLRQHHHFRQLRYFYPQAYDHRF